jgi:aspartate 1-decarboxylase
MAYAQVEELIPEASKPKVVLIDEQTAITEVWSMRHKAD